MHPLQRRFYRNLILTTVLAAVIVAVHRWAEASLFRADVYSGIALLGGVWFLALIHLRKKLSTLPLGNVSTWMQVHLCVGWLSILGFGLHVGWKLPNGWLEGTVAILFLLTAGSGVLGLYLTRTIPKQLARVGEEIIYERIPFFRRSLLEDARRVLLEAAAITDSPVLANFYAAKLQPFLAQPRPWTYRVNPSNRRRRFLLAEFESLSRYLSEQEQKLCERLFAIVRKKDDLDYHEALQSKLRLWLFVHIGLTYPLLLLGTLHGILALAFLGGM